MPTTRKQVTKKPQKTVITRGQRAKGAKTPETNDAERSPRKVKTVMPHNYTLHMFYVLIKI